MRRLFLLLFSCTVLSATAQNDSVIIRNLFTQSLTNGKAYERLRHICKQIGPRLSGSENAAKAVAYVRAELAAAGFDSVWLQPVIVPHWLRGPKEEANYTSGGKIHPLHCTALGGSIATEKEGLKGDVIEITDFDQLKKDSAAVKGKIVFFNHVMKAEFINTFEAYGEAAKYRYFAAIQAGYYGAKGVVVRSMTVNHDDYPHTGMMAYADSVAKIPGLAISTNDADQLSAALKADPKLQLMMKLKCKIMRDAPSSNVVAEIRGTEHPEEIITTGGHLDSWDLAEGAHDDGTGVVQSMEVLQLIHDLGLKPKRTIRCVAFINEENGGKGGTKYAELAKANKEKIIAAIESDAGGFTPRGFTFKGDSLQVLKAMSFKKQLEDYQVNIWKKGYGGADINHLEGQGTLLIGFSPDSQRYFDIHHSALDTFEQVNYRELQLGAATMAALAWMLSENW